MSQDQQASTPPNLDELEVAASSDFAFKNGDPVSEIDLPMRWQILGRYAERAMASELNAVGAWSSLKIAELRLAQTTSKKLAAEEVAARMGQERAQAIAQVGVAQEATAKAVAALDLLVDEHQKVALQLGEANQQLDQARGELERFTHIINQKGAYAEELTRQLEAAQAEARSWAHRVADPEARCTDLANQLAGVEQKHAELILAFNAQNNTLIEVVAKADRADIYLADANKLSRELGEARGQIGALEAKLAKRAAKAIAAPEPTPDSTPSPSHAAEAHHLALAASREMI